jgi:hypothetical protein
MPIIDYDVKISNIDYQSNISYSQTGITFGSRTKSTRSGRTIVDMTKTPSAMTDGTLIRPDIVSNKDSILISNEDAINNNRIIATQLNGLSTAAYKEIRIDSPEYVKTFGVDPVLGAPSLSSLDKPRAFIFRRLGGTLSVEKEFILKDRNTDDSNVGQDDFTEIYYQDSKYLLFGIRKPIPLTTLRGSSIDVGINEYLELSLNYQSKLTSLGIEEDLFFDICDYISTEDLKIKSWNLQDTTVSLSAKYFPIFPHVTVLARMENGIQQIPLDYFNEVFVNRGVVSFSGSKVAKIMGDCLGFYMFYGCVPSVHHSPDDIVIPLHSVISEDRSILSYGISHQDKEGQLVISEPLVSILRDITHSSTLTEVTVPQFYSNVFIEPTSHIQINGKTYGPSNRMFVNNDGPIGLELSAPDHLFELVERTEIDTSSGNSIQINSPIVGEAAAIYGLFKSGTMNRLSLMSIYKVSNAIPPENVVVSEAVGFGLGNFSSGGFGLGSIQTYYSSATYTNANPYDYSTEYTRNLSVRVVPEIDGHDFILPAWTVKNNVSVFEMSETHYETFTGWRFIEPDIITLDKDMVHPTRTYEIVFEAIASPYVPNVNLETNSLNLIVDRDPGSSYQSFGGLYLLGSKEIKLRIGYIDELGAKNYFSNEVTVHLTVTNNYLDQTISRLKSISF